MAHHNTVPIEQINGYLDFMVAENKDLAFELPAKDAYHAFLTYAIDADIENPISYRQFGNFMARLSVIVHRTPGSAYIFTKYTERL